MASLPKLSGEKFTTGTTKAVRFTVRGDVSEDLAAILRSLGYNAEQHGAHDFSFISPLCSTPAEIDRVRNPLRGKVM
jgi:hypothetical protein